MAAGKTLASNTAAALRYYANAGGTKTTGKGRPLDFRELISLAREGDREALEALQQMALNLGRGVRMIASALAPAEIVIVGDVAAAWDLCGPIAQAELSRNALSTATRPAPVR